MAEMAIQRIGPKPSDFAKAFDLVRARVQEVLPPGVSLERVFGMAQMAYGTDPKIQDCEGRSVLRCVVEAASIGLPLDKVSGLAYMVPFRNNKRGGIYEATLIIGYQGKQELAYRSGKVVSINAEVVHEKDKFVVRRGTNEEFLWEPYLLDDPGEVIASFAIARMQDGSQMWVVIPRRDLDRVDASMKESGRLDSPWRTDKEAMQRKTAIHRLYKVLPKTPEMAISEAIDNREEMGRDLDIPVVPMELPGVTEEAKTGMEALKGKLAGGLTVPDPKEQFPVTGGGAPTSTAPAAPSLPPVPPAKRGPGRPRKEAQAPPPASPEPPKPQEPPQPPQAVQEAPGEANGAEPLPEDLDHAEEQEEAATEEVEAEGEAEPVAQTQKQIEPPAEIEDPRGLGAIIVACSKLNEVFSKVMKKGVYLELCEKYLGTAADGGVVMPASSRDRQALLRLEWHLLEVKKSL